MAGVVRRRIWAGIIVRMHRLAAASCAARTFKTELQTLIPRLTTSCIPTRPTVQGCAPRSLTALTRRVRPQTHTPNTVWIGNAAQTLHPVAGQGLNLGLRDAYVLAERLGQAWRCGRSAQSIVDAWARQRRTDRSMLVALTDLMASSFTWPIARPVQSVVLGALELLGPARRTLARTLMYGLR